MQFGKRVSMGFQSTQDEENQANECIEWVAQVSILRPGFLGFIGYAGKSRSQKEQDCRGVCGQSRIPPFAKSAKDGAPDRWSLGERLERGVASILNLPQTSLLLKSETLIG
jgi:hypothetical protein